MKYIIEISHLHVVLGGEFKALNNITINLLPGRITGFIGPSGAGKTTLMRTIVGRQRSNSGIVRVMGMSAGSPQLRPKIRYMTQELSVYADLSVQENVRYFARMLGMNGRQAAAECRRVLEQVALSDKAGVVVTSLSGGQKQRVSLAVALLGDADILVLDEPTVGLDPVLREQLWKLFREQAAAGKTIIVSSHVMDEAERCDDLLLIRDAQVVASGTPTELCKNTGTKTVERAFLKLAGGQTA
jgi:ABC-2 type transport system ATP-binding protein